MGYRTDYEKRTRKKVPSSFTVHHINHDRSDNDIFNLVALPSGLHVKYHQLYPTFVLEEEHLFLPVNTDELIDAAAIVTRLQKFIEVREDCVKWINFRNSLLGIEPKKYKGYGY